MEIRKDRFKELDGLRAFAIILVVMYHLSGYLTTELFGLKSFLKTGHNGVDLFFILSGFLVGRLAFSEIKKNNQLKIFHFWGRRFLRTWPLYFIFLAYFLFKTEYEIVPSLWRYITFTQNLGEMNAFVQSWSLAVEEQFYFVLPLLLVTFFKFSSRKPLVATSIILFICAYIFRFYSTNTSHTIASLDTLILGIFVSYFDIFESEKMQKIKHSPYLFFLLGLILIYIFYIIELPDHWNRVLRYGSQSIGFAFLLISALSEKTTKLSNFLSSKVLYFTALFSYSIYLSHTIIIYKIGRNYFQFIQNDLIRDISILAAGLFASIGLGGICYYIVEKPLLKVRDLVVR